MVTGSYLWHRLIISSSLVPPSLLSGTEIFLGPRREKDLSIVGSITVGKSERKRSGSTNNGSIGGVLRSVAWAHELVVGSRPWDNASQVCADGVESIVFQSLVVLNDEVTVETETKKMRIYMIKITSNSLWKKWITHVASPFKPWASERSPAGLDDK